MKGFRKEFSRCIIKFRASLETFGIQVQQRTVAQHVLHFGYPKIDVPSHISK
jgi:hypothetical protein